MAITAGPARVFGRHGQRGVGGGNPSEFALLPRLRMPALTLTTERWFLSVCYRNASLGDRRRTAVVAVGQAVVGEALQIGADEGLLGGGRCRAALAAIELLRQEDHQCAVLPALPEADRWPRPLAKEVLRVVRLEQPGGQVLRCEVRP